MSPDFPLLDRIRQAQPRLALVLGSGLGSVVQRVHASAAVRYEEIPGLAATSVHGHTGQLLLARWHDVPLLICQGRMHFYEGHPWPVVLALIDLLHRCGVQELILTNAAGGIHPSLDPGQLMLISRHLTFLDRNAWRHVEVASPYCLEMNERLRQCARECAIPLATGCYAALTGPSYETPAEIRALASQRVDAVGMSTAREAERAQQHGIRVAAISCITNKAAGLAPGRLDHGDVLLTASAPAENLGTILQAYLAAATPVGDCSIPQG